MEACPGRAPTFLARAAFSAASRCGLMEARTANWCRSYAARFSAASRCGLMEARPAAGCPARPDPRFPQRHAAASWKHYRPGREVKLTTVFSAASRCGLMEAASARSRCWSTTAFSAASRCGLMEASAGSRAHRALACVFRSVTLRPHGSPAVRRVAHARAFVRVFRSVTLRPHGSDAHIGASDAASVVFRSVTLRPHGSTPRATVPVCVEVVFRSVTLRPHGSFLPRAQIVPLSSWFSAASRCGLMEAMKAV